MSSNIIYLGVKAHAVAIDKTTGATLWKTNLKGGATSGQPFVTLLVQEGRVFAHTYGELFCLDQHSGAILWKNALEGLGYDIAALATEGDAAASAQMTAALKNKRSREAISNSV